jgi:TRAP-type mannitol/chloroaromatic compound transport system permease small subunit
MADQNPSFGKVFSTTGKVCGSLVLIPILGFVAVVVGAAFVGAAQNIQSMEVSDAAITFFSKLFVLFSILAMAVATIIVELGTK